MSVDQDTSEVLRNTLTIKSEESFGSLSGVINTTKESYIIQLVDPKFNVIQEATVGEKYNFNKLDPGEYQIRILIDTNGNGQWDPGDIRRNIQPEPIIIYMDEKGVNKTSIRANWELNVDLYF